MENLLEQIITHNTLYRLGIPKISDYEFDRLVEMYIIEFGSKPDIEASYAYGSVIKLPHQMGSLKKLKTIEETKKWLNGYDDMVTLSPKLDGISIEVGNCHAMSKNENGITGTIVTNQFMLIQNASHHLSQEDYFRGEAVISNENFEKHFKPLEYSHPRNAVAGLFNSKSPSKELMSFVEFVPFDKCGNDGNDWKQSSTIFKTIHSKDLTHELLSDVFYSWKKLYPCDGVVIDLIDNSKHQGCETGTINPKASKAYKHVSFDDIYESEIIGITRQISKNGVYNPVLNIKPTVIDGSNITNINVDNELFVKIFGMGIGTKIGLKKSGGIIPRLVSVEDVEIPNRKELLKVSKNHTIDEIRDIYFFPKDFQDKYNEPDFKYFWDGVCIKAADNSQNKGISIRLMEHFVTKTKAKGFGISTLEHMFDSHGIDTISKLILFDFNKLINDDGFGNKTAETLKNELNKSINGIDEHTFMAASGFFPNLGSTKLKLYLLDGIEAKGLGSFATSTIDKGLLKYEEFKKQVESLGYIIKKPISDKDFIGHVYCPTNCRFHGKLAEAIENAGHKIQDNWNNSVTHVVRLNENIVSGKTRKAKANGLPIITLVELENEFIKKEVKNDSLF